MTSNTRRPGFRLPWSVEPGDDQRQAAADEMEQAPAPHGEASAAATESTASPADALPAATDAATDIAPDADPAADTSGFLANLVSAMRSVAEEARDAGLSEYRESVESRVAELESAAAERAEELRRRADLDITGVGDWERAEIERARAEAERRVEARRQQLEQQLTDHQTSSEREIAAARRRLEEHERELTAFFAQLSDIRDPAAFVAAAKRMPRPPDIGGGRPAGAGASVASGETLNQRLAQLGVDKDADAAAASAAVSDAAPSTGADAPSPDAEVVESPPVDTAEHATPPLPEPQPEAAPTPTEAGRDASLAERLAQLDDRLAPTTEGPVATPGAADDATPSAAEGEPAAGSGETSTAIIVKGLGSFGAITSFKQALERVEGVHGVTLSLGPTGEFVYRASHAAEFDVVAAIRSVEGEHAEIERADGQVRVTVSRQR